MDVVSFSPYQIDCADCRSGVHVVDAVMHQI